MSTNPRHYIVVCRCPYCGTEHSLALPAIYAPSVVACDADVGGCDRYFAVRASIKVSAEVLRIEGETLRVSEVI